MSSPGEDARRSRERDAALRAITAALTESETARILDNLAFPGSPLHGAKTDDLLDMADNHDSYLDKTEPFYAVHRSQLPDVPGLHFAVLALCMQEKPLTGAGVKELLARAGLLAAS